jgi:hypothetical protein
MKNNNYKEPMVAISLDEIERLLPAIEKLIVEYRYKIKEL